MNVSSYIQQIIIGIIIVLAVAFDTFAKSPPANRMSREISRAKSLEKFPRSVISVSLNGLALEYVAHLRFC